MIGCVRHNASSCTGRGVSELETTPQIHAAMREHCWALRAELATTGKPVAIVKAERRRTAADLQAAQRAARVAPPPHLHERKAGRSTSRSGDRVLQQDGGDGPARLPSHGGGPPRCPPSFLRGCRRPSLRGETRPAVNNSLFTTRPAPRIAASRRLKLRGPFFFGPLQSHTQRSRSRLLSNERRRTRSNGPFPLGRQY